jgi:hypothetical protein
MNSIVYFIGFGCGKSFHGHPANAAENGLEEEKNG